MRRNGSGLIWYLKPDTLQLLRCIFLIIKRIQTVHSAVISKRGINLNRSDVTIDWIYNPQL